MNFIRDKKVDILSYLPFYLRKDATFKSVNDADSVEHERLRLAIIDMQQQLYVETATWGLERWEEYLGLTPKDKDIKLRRIAILQALNRNSTSTIDFITNIANSFVTDKSVRAIEKNSNYSFELRWNRGECWDFERLRNGVERFKPAHLGAIYIEEYFLELNSTIGGLCTFEECTEIEMAEEYSAPQLLQQLRVGGVLTFEEETVINPDLMYEAPEVNMRLCVAGYITVDETIIIE